jgi:undecaprenyl-diphosphatase
MARECKSLNWDSQLVALFNRGWTHPVLDGLMVAVTASAMPVAGIVPVLLWLAGKRREGFALLVTCAASTLLAVGVQFLVMRPRPVDVRAVQPASAFPSFPSGHAAAAFGGATLAGLVWRRAGLLALPGAILVSFSRLYLGQHYPSDLLGGAILGVAVATAVYGCWYRPGDATRPRWVWLLWSQVGVVLLASLGAYLGLLRFDLLALPGADKLLHLLLFGGVAFLAMGWWAGRSQGAVLAVLSLLATAEEALQALSPVRSFDLADLAFTLAGVVLLGWLGAIVRRRSTLEANEEPIKHH